MTTKTLDNKSAFAQYEWQVSEPWAIIGGMRYDDTSSGGDATTANLGTVYQFNPMANLRVRYAQGFRAPDIQGLDTRFGWRVSSDLNLDLAINLLDS